MTAPQGPSLVGRQIGVPVRGDLLKDWQDQKDTMLAIADAMPEEMFRRESSRRSASRTSTALRCSRSRPTPASPTRSTRRSYRDTRIVPRIIRRWGRHTYS